MVVSHVHHAITFIAAKAHYWDRMTIVLPHEKIAWCWLRTRQKSNHFKAFPDAPKRSQMPQSIPRCPKAFPDAPKHSQMPQTVLFSIGQSIPPTKSPLVSCRFRMFFCFFVEKNANFFWGVPRILWNPGKLTAGTWKSPTLWKGDII